MLIRKGEIMCNLQVEVFICMYIGGLTHDTTRPLKHGRMVLSSTISSLTTLSEMKGNIKIELL